MDVLLRGLLLGLEGVEPDEGEGVDVVGVGGDREPRLHETEGFVVGLEEVTARRERRIGVALHVGAELLQGLEIVLKVLRLALGVVEGHVVAERAVEIYAVRFLLEDRQHDVCRGGRRRRRGHGKRKKKIPESLINYNLAWINKSSFCFSLRCLSKLNYPSILLCVNFVSFQGWSGSASPAMTDQSYTMPHQRVLNFRPYTVKTKPYFFIY